MTNAEPNTAQSIVDGQLAELQITSAEVTGETYKEQHDAKIKALDAEEAALPTPTDKASLQAVQDIITKTERARTGIDKWRKAFKDQWKKIIDPVDAYIGTNKENGMQARIYAIQERAEAKKKAYLDEQAKAQREADRLLEERYTGRVAKLTGAGMTFDAAGNLTIRDGEQTMSVLPTQVRFFDDAQFDKGLERVQAIAHKIREAEAAALQAKEAQEREEAEERERLAQQKREQDADAAKLKAEREQLERDRAEMRKTKNEMRAVDLETLGGVWVTEAPARIEFGGTSLPVHSLADFDDEKWQEVRGWVRDAKVKAIEEQKEWDAQMKRAADRGEELRALGAEQYEDGAWHLGVIEGDPDVTQLDLRTMTSDEWAPVLARFKEAARARDNKPHPDDCTADLPEFPYTPDSPPYVAPIATGNDDDTHGPPQVSIDTVGPLAGKGWPKSAEPLQEGSAVVGSPTDWQRIDDGPVNAEEYRENLSRVVGAQPEAPWWEVRTEYVFSTSIQADTEEAATEAALKDGPPCASIIVSRRVVAISQATEVIRRGE